MQSLPTSGRALFCSWRRVLQVGVLLLASLPSRQSLAASSEDAPPPPGSAMEHEAHVLETRLLAPCCWQQTLDAHVSPLASELRLEIRGRLQAGERVTAVEDDLIARYGETMRAVPAGTDRRIGLGVASASLFTVSGLGLLLRFVRRRRSDGAPGEPGEPGVPVTTHDDYDDRLDRELASTED